MSEEGEDRDSSEEAWAPKVPVVPKGWAVADFEEAFQTVSVNGKKVPSKDCRPSGALPVVDQGQSFISGFTDDESLAIDPGDGLIVFGDHTRAFKRVTFRFAAGADGIKALQPLPFDSQYAYYACSNLSLPNRGYSRHYSFLARCKVPVAPANEQRRIVSKIDELFSRIDEGEAALKRVEKLVERYRQSVLKAAVMGELTREWRAARKRAGEPVESGAALLARILKARRAAWEAAELAKLQAKDKPPTDERWKQKYQEPAPPDTTGLPELPEGWVWASLDMISDVTGGITVDAKRSAEGCELVPYLRVANVQRGYLDLAEVKSLLAPAERIKALALRDGDVLFNEGGDLDKLGRGWVWDGQIPVCIHQNHVFRARLYSGTSRSRLVSWYANEMGRSFFLDKGKQTTNLASISLTKLKALPVPVMSELEAVEIEGRASAALSELERQITEVKSAKRRSAALRQAILKAAFSGQLVPQDPSDEPASKLLERIAAERASASEHPRRKTKRSTVNHG